MYTRALPSLRIVKILLCLASMSLCALAYANGGTVRFSGRIVESGCAASLSNSELKLSACPLSAAGSTVRVVALGDGQAIELRDAKRRGRQLALVAIGMKPGQVSFSLVYRLEPHPQLAADNGAYMAVLDYL